MNNVKLRKGKLSYPRIFVWREKSKEEKIVKLNNQEKRLIARRVRKQDDNSTSLWVICEKVERERGEPGT